MASTKKAAKRRKSKAPKSEALPTTKKEQEAYVRAVARTCQGPMKEGYREKIGAAFAKGNESEAKQLGAEARDGCGFDFNDLIVENGFDGKDRVVPCPKCGVEISYRAPLFGAEPPVKQTKGKG